MWINGKPISEISDGAIKAAIAEHEARNEVVDQEWIVGLAEELRFRARHPEYRVA